MSDSANTTPRIDSMGRSIPEGFGGAQPGAGRPGWVLTDERRQTIITAAKMGYRIKDIGPLVGIAATTFDTKKREIPEIDDLIEEGRRQGREKLITLSHDIVFDPAFRRDSARNQELARLHRMVKTEEPESAAESDDQTQLGFTIKVIPNKTVANTANTASQVGSHG